MTERDNNEKTTVTALRREIRLLGFELGRVIRDHAGQDAYDLVERVRGLSKARRAGDTGAATELDAVIESLSPEQAAVVIRAFACFFDLANIAEDRQRVRELRRRARSAYPRARPESIGATMEKLADAGVDADAIRDMMNQVDIELVFTAHPTEAKRRTVRRTLRRLRETLAELDDPDILHAEREAVLRRIRADIACLWHTDPLRSRRPTVIDEVKRSLFTFNSLWRVIPDLYRDIRESTERVFGRVTEPGRQFLRFGSWIGGDRDGNPFVTPQVTEQTLKLLRERTIDKHIGMCDRLAAVLTISSDYHTPSDDLLQAVTDARAKSKEIDRRLEALHPAETYRHWLAVIRARLVTTSASPVAWQPDAADGDHYASPAALEHDIRLMQRSLLDDGQLELAHGGPQAWLDRVDVFGFQFARLDIREHAGVLGECVGELAKVFGLCDDYAGLAEEGRVDLLSKAPAPDECVAVDIDALSESSAKTVRLFQLLDQVASAPGGDDALGVFIISMTRSASDVLAVLWLSGVAAAMHGRPSPAALPIAPLFETIDDLHQAGDTLERMLDHPVYREHVRAGGDRQVCMIGYSDSAKDGGYLAANWALHEAQRRLVAVGGEHGVGVTFFHGRGGALGRGGGPTARSILGLPPDTFTGRMRMTEQGEVLAERYDDLQIARRHLEQVIGASLRVKARSAPRIDASWQAALQAGSEASLRDYRALIDDPAFLHYFETATPISGIERLPIGSRPSRRSGQRTLSQLRAIPFTFAWTQSRHFINALYGLGAGLAACAENDPQLLREMYEQWPWFRAVIDNGELALAKADMDIAAHYAHARDDDENRRLFGVIQNDIQLTRKLLLNITGGDEPLAGAPWLRASIETRNPYVDPLNLIQVRLLAQLNDPPAAEDDAARLENLLRHSIQGIAGGLRTTG